jgi:hypothetical protein
MMSASDAISRLSCAIGGELVQVCTRIKWDNRGEWRVRQSLVHRKNPRHRMSRSIHVIRAIWLVCGAILGGIPVGLHAW